VSVICDTSIMSERPECPFIGMPPRINPCTVAECKYVGGAVTAGCCQAIQEYCPSSGDPGCRSDIITNVIFSCEVFQVTGSSIISYSNDGFTTNDYSSFNCTGQPTVMPYPYQLDTCFFDPVYSQQYAKISFLNDTDLHPVYSLTLPGSLVWKYDSSSACAENTIFGYAYEPYLNNSGQLCDSRVEAPCLVNYNMDLNTKYVREDCWVGNGSVGDGADGSVGPSWALGQDMTILPQHSGWLIFNVYNSSSCTATSLMHQSAFVLGSCTKEFGLGCPFGGMTGFTNPCSTTECRTQGDTMSPGCCGRIQDYCLSSNDPGCNSSYGQHHLTVCTDICPFWVNATSSSFTNPCNTIACKTEGDKLTEGCCEAIMAYCPQSGDPGCSTTNGKEHISICKTMTKRPTLKPTKIPTGKGTAKPTAKPAIVKIVFQMDVTVLTSKASVFKQNFTNTFLAANKGISASQIIVLITYKDTLGHDVSVGRRALTASEVTITITVQNPSPAQTATIAQASTVSTQALLEQSLPSLGLTATQISTIAKTATVTVIIQTLKPSSRPSSAPVAPVAPPSNPSNKMSAASATHYSIVAMLVSTGVFIWMFLRKY